MKKYDDQILVDEYKCCNKLRLVAEKYGCSDETVRRALIKHSVPRVEHKPKKQRRTKRATKEELVAIAEEYYREDCTVADLARKYHRAPNTISAGLKKYGNGLKRYEANGKKVTDEQILADIAEGLTRSEIAKKRGVHVENLQKRMKKLGVHARYQVASTCIPKPETREWHYTECQKRLVDEKQPDFEFIAYKNRHVKMRCKRCGDVLIRDNSTIRRYKTTCPKCEEQAKQEEEIKQERIKLMRFFNVLIESKTPKQCATCGKEFYSQYPDTRYCSKRCRQRRNGRKSNYRQRCRKYGVLYDSTVTREKVMQRDGKRCQICGKLCDESDRRWGTFGPDFPTLDHITPLSQGGTHTWDNVQCACAICNSIKRDLITA